MLRMQSVSLILLALFSTNLAQQQFPFCPIGWHFGIQMGQCYLLPDDMRLDWHDADEYCRNVSGGQLVSVETRLEFDYLTTIRCAQQSENETREFAEDGGNFMVATSCPDEFTHCRYTFCIFFNSKVVEYRDCAKPSDCNDLDNYYRDAGARCSMHNLQG